MAKKHKLTTKNDMIGGVGGADLYLAPLAGGKATLSNKDSLNGKGGIDTINAVITGNSLAPKLVSIENGIFARKGTADLSLDLGKATSMKAITLNKFDADVMIKNAKKLASVTITDSADDMFTISGVKATVEQKLNFKNVANGTVTLTSGDAMNLTKVAVVLENSMVSLKGNAAAATVGITSNGTVANRVYFDNTDTSSIKDVVITGAASVDMYRAAAPAVAEVKAVAASAPGVTPVVIEVKAVAAKDAVVAAGELTGLKSFDATGLTGTAGVHAMIGGTELTKVVGGNGADHLIISKLGGTATAKAAIDLKVGDDMLDMTRVVINTDALLDTMTVEGGLGVDTLHIKGEVGAKFATTVNGFEKLNITDTKGAYKLDTEFTDVTLTSVLADATFTDMKAAPFVAATTVVHASGGANFTISAPFTHSLGIALTPIVAGGTDDVLNLRIDGAYTTAANSVSSSLKGLTITGADIINISNKSAVVPAATTTGVATAPTVWLKDVGSMADGVDINVTGEMGTGPIVTTAVLGAKALNLAASVGSMLYVDKLTITNTAGVDLTGLVTVDDTKGFQKAVIIAGGTGADQLVGSKFADTISTGGGGDKVHGSLGADAVTLGAGADVLVFKNAAQSLNTAEYDTVTGFATGVDDINLAGLNLTLTAQGFGGVVTDIAAGNTAMSAANSSIGIFMVGNSLYIDSNNDNAITAADMRIDFAAATTLVAGDFLFA